MEKMANDAGPGIPGGGNSASRPGSVSNRGFECAQLTSHKNYQNNRREFHNKYNALIVFEDGEKLNLRTNDPNYDKLFQQLFGKGCELNANLLQLSVQRYRNNSKKNPERIDKKTILGTLKDIPVVAVPDRSTRPSKEMFVYNPERSRLHAPVDKPIKYCLENMSKFDTKTFKLLGDDNRIVGLSSGSISDFKDILRPYSLKRYLPENTTLHDISPKKDRTLFRIVEANQTPPQVIHNLQEMPLVLGKEKINHMVFLLDAKKQRRNMELKGRLSNYKK